MEQPNTGEKRPIFERYFSFVESLKPSDKMLFIIALVVFIGAAFFALLTLNDHHKKTIATTGGTLVEGIVGTPRFVNPVLAITRADQDIAALVYSGLMRLGSDGELTNDLAESVTISDDGLVYNVVLKQDVRFQDDMPLTAADVAFTIGLIQNPTLKSPLRGNWNDIVVEVINDHELNFVLEEAYSPFIENLTVGILPKHIWGELSIEQLPFSQHNTEPIGTGPYALEKVTYNKSGLIEDYTLTAFPRAENAAKIASIKLRFYPNEETLVEAFADGEFDASATFSYASLNQIDTESFAIIEHPLPRVFSVFFNQNKSAALRDEAARKALNVAINRDELILNALNGYGVPSTSPVPPGFLTDATQAGSTSTPTTTSHIRQAETILLDGGWEKQDDGSWQKDIDDVPTKLELTITTANTEIFEKTAEFIKQAWSQLGVDVSIALFEQTDLLQVIIRPRDYQALLFGIDVGRPLDMYPFWHSSQKDDPGLNVALYTNITTDALLEKARTTQDDTEKHEALTTFVEEITEETPAIFLYSPSFTYVVRNDITVSPIKRIVRPSERFSEVYQWHMRQNDVWPLFAD